MNTIKQYSADGPGSAYKYKIQMKYLRIIFTILVLTLVSCTPKTGSFSFVQLSDPQLGMGGYEHDVEAFQQAVEKINAMDVDFVVICGDLVNHASDSSFADYKALRDQLEIPFYEVPGNHDIGREPTDSSLQYYRNTIGKDYYTMDHEDVSFIFVNTQLWKTESGDESTLHDDWFKSTINSPDMEERIIVVGHYPLFIKEPAEEEIYSNLPAGKREELLGLLRKNDVVAYLSGHRHESVIHNYEGVQLVTGETTSRQFDERPLGFRQWTVMKDTVIHAFVELDAE